MPHKELLIPVRKCRSLPGRLTVGREVILQTRQDADRLPLGQLRDDLGAIGVGARISRSSRAADVRIVRDENIRGAEAYRLTVRPDGIEILSSGPAGAYYGVQTLRDLLTVHGKTLPAMRIDDWPDFVRRGVHYDCSRGKVPKVKTVKKLIERLARWKINELQLYVENVFTFAGHPAIGRDHSPFTPEDIIAIRRHCKAHHVRLVGSLSTFGHMEKVLALEEYRHLGEMPGHKGFAGGTTLCPSDPGSIGLVRDMLGEFMPLFDATDFNVCCDEPWELGKGRSRKRADRIGLGRVYLEFILKIHEICLKHGKRMNMWADIVLAHPQVLPQLPKDIVMLNWDYAPRGQRIGRSGEIVDAGLSLVCCPGTHGWESHGTRMGLSIANVENFARVARRYRADGFLNTDWGDCGHRNTLGVSLHGFAHGAACSWAGAKVDHGRFTERFCRHVFGDRKGVLAPAMRILGADPGGFLYYALIEPFGPGKTISPLTGIRLADVPGIISRASRQRRAAARYSPLPKLAAGDPLKAMAAERLESVDGLRIPKVDVADEFESIALEEFDLARRMDLLACRRILIKRDLEAGKEIASGSLRSLAGDMRIMSDDFGRLWRARNRPSRLRDNLRAFRRVIAEAETAR